MKVMIIGGGKMIYFLCRTFLSKGYEVTVINKNHDECVYMARHLNVTVVEGDGSEPRILEEAGGLKVEIILAVTPNDEDNLVISQLAQRRFKIPRAIALVNDPDNENIFENLGIEAFPIARMIASLLEQKTGIDEVMNLIPVGEGKVNLTELILEHESPIVGKSLKEIQFPEHSLIAMILRNEQPIVPHGDTVLKFKDRLVLVTLPENHGQVVKMITGEER